MFILTSYPNTFNKKKVIKNKEEHVSPRPKEGEAGRALGA